MADTILVINAGSSSIKFQLFALTGEGDLTRQLKGQFDGIGTHPRAWSRATPRAGNWSRRASRPRAWPMSPPR